MSELQTQNITEADVVLGKIANGLQSAASDHILGIAKDIYDTKQQRNEAIADMKKAYELNNEFIICNYLIATDYDALGKYKEAYNYYLAYANSNAQEDEYKNYAKARAEELKEYATK